jgi:hypothetical protein
VKLDAEMPKKHDGKNFNHTQFQGLRKSRKVKKSSGITNRLQEAPELLNQHNSSSPSFLRGSIPSNLITKQFAAEIPFRSAIDIFFKTSEDDQIKTLTKTRQSPKLLLSFNPFNAQNFCPSDCGYELFMMNFFRGIFTMKVSYEPINFRREIQKAQN